MLKEVTNSDAFLLCIIQENNCPLFYFQNSLLISYSVTYLEKMLLKISPEPLWVLYHISPGL